MSKGMSMSLRGNAHRGRHTRSPTHWYLHWVYVHSVPMRFDFIATRWLNRLDAHSQLRTYTPSLIHKLRWEHLQSHSFTHSHGVVEDIRAQWITRSQDDTHCEMKRTTVRCTATRCYILRDEEIKLMKHSLTYSLPFSWRLYSLFYIDLLRSWVDTVTHTLTRWCTHTEKRAHSPMQWLSCLLRRCYLLHTDVSPFMQTGSLNRPCSHAYIHMVVTLAGTLLLSFTSS